MKKMKVMIIILIMILLVGCTNKEEKKVMTDAKKFKEEYESINNKINEKNNKKYRAVSISKDNPFVYATAEEIAEKMDKKETFVVYFGFKECPWCRSVIEQLIKVAEDQRVGKIYYVDVKDIRDVKELDEEGNITTKEEGTEGYRALIEKMSDVLEEYTLQKEDEKVEVGEKRIYAPNVVAISAGKAIQLETGCNEELDDPYVELTDSIKKYSYNKFECLLECLEEESTTCQKNKC